MQAIAIIPSRYASVRFPGKPLTVIDGVSMVMRVYEQAKKIKAFNRVVIATEDERIFDHAKQYGADVLMTSADHNSGTERCAEAIRKIGMSDEDIIVNVQGDEPFIQPQQLELILNTFSNREIQIATLAKKTSAEIQSDPNVVKVVFDKNYYALYFSRSAIPYQRNATENIYKHIGLYAYRNEILQKIVALEPTPLEIAESLEQLRWIENGYKIKVIETEFDTISIDTKEDLDKISKSRR